MQTKTKTQADRKPLNNKENKKEECGRERELRPQQTQVVHPELIGKWTFTEMINSVQKTIEYKETWTFYKNGILKWTEEEVGLGKSSDKYRYTIKGDRLITTWLRSPISDEAIFSINGNKLSIRDRISNETMILIKERGNR